ncbi:MAG TPA: glycosyltransferase family 61 protein, partial [Puia sp.]|nr:glycosyltransferase family 61 protein [Puia sp.]
LIVLDDGLIYLAIHHPWFNYYHWICESIFRLWMVRRRLNNLRLLLPEYYREVDFIQGSLEPFKLNKIYYMPNGKHVLVRNACIPQIKPICDSYNTTHVNQIRNFYRNYVCNENQMLGQKNDRLYISRKLAGRRRIINEDEICTILIKYDFSIFYPENHCFIEQVACFKGVKYLIGQHGSGLTNMLFMNKGTCILELHKNTTNELNHPGFLFWYMAESLGINYYHQVCETSGKEDYFETKKNQRAFLSCPLLLVVSDTTVVDLKGFPGGSIEQSPDHRYSLLFRDGVGEKAIQSGPHTPPVCYEQDLSGYTANGIREGGIVGTDILSQLILTLDYKYSRLYIATDKDKQYLPERLRELGFISSSMTGYFSNDESTLILRKISKNHEKNNNPYVKIALYNDKDSANAFGSIDPGYDDRVYLNQDYDTYYTHCVNINQPYLDHLLKKGINIVVNKDKYLTLGNRTNTPDTLFKCTFEKKYIFSMISTEGKPIYPYPSDSVNVFLKVNGKGAASAGGITTYEFPLIQFGGSFLLDFDEVIFDPFRSLVWFRKP